MLSALATDSQDAEAAMPSECVRSWALAEVVLFHHALGLTDPVRRFAAALRGAGHTVHAPDLYDGRTFDTIEDGLAHSEEIGGPMAIVDRARVAVESLPLGQWGDNWPATWPEGVRLQLHILEGDEDFEFAQGLAAIVPGAELFVYPGTEHYFAEHDDQAAALLTQRVLAFLG